MINLLPTEFKKSLAREYHRRFVVVSSLFFACFLLVLIIILAVFYISLRIRHANIEANLAEEKKEVSAVAAARLEADAAALGEKLKSLRVFSAAGSATALIKDLLNQKSSGITLSEIVYDAATSDGSSAMRLAGTAQTRAQFLTFVDELRTSKLFKQVDSPVSNLIKDREVKFTLSLPLNEK